MSKPEILFLSLAFVPIFDELYDDLITRIAEKATIKRIKTSSAAHTYLDALTLTNPNEGTNSPRAILLTDNALTKSQNQPILDKVLAYARAGGTVVVGFHLCSFTRMDAFDRFFNQGCGLPWKSGDYHREDFEYNSFAGSGLALEGGGSGGGDATPMPGPYSMKALHVKDAQGVERVFVPVGEAGTSRNGQAPVAGTKMGDQGGRLFYIGDVNAEITSTQVVLALCGL